LAIGINDLATVLIIRLPRSLLILSSFLPTISSTFFLSSAPFSSSLMILRFLSPRDQRPSLSLSLSLSLGKCCSPVLIFPFESPPLHPHPSGFLIFIFRLKGFGCPCPTRVVFALYLLALLFARSDRSTDDQHRELFWRFRPRL